MQIHNPYHSEQKLSNVAFYSLTGGSFLFFTAVSAGGVAFGIITLLGNCQVLAASYAIIDMGLSITFIAGSGFFELLVVIALSSITVLRLYALRPPKEANLYVPVSYHNKVSVPVPYAVKKETEVIPEPVVLEQIAPVEDSPYSALPNELYQHIFTFLPYQALGNAGKVNKCSRTNADLLFIERARDKYGYEGSNAAEAKEYVRLIFCEIHQLIKEDAIPKSLIAYHIRQKSTFTRENYIDPEGTIENLSRPEGKELFKASLDKLLSRYLFHSYDVNYGMAHLLLKWGADPNLVFLSAAANNRHKKAVALLLKNGANPDTPNNKGQTALMLTSDKEIASLLLQHGANPNCEDAGGLTPLFYGSRNPEILSLLLENGAGKTIDKKYGPQEETAIFKACNEGNEKSVAILLKAGADPSVPNKNNVAPIHNAAKKGNIALSDQLLDTGKVDIDAATPLGTTPLMYATGHPKLVDHLLGRGANIGCATKKGNTALHFAADENNKGSVEILRAWGADATYLNGEGITPAEAMKKPDPEIKRLLTKASPIHVAVELGRKDLVSKYLDSGVSVEEKSESGSTPLLIAASEGSYGCMEILLQRGADARAQDSEGNTALSIAIQKDFKKTTEFLLPFAKENINIPNNKQETPIFFALNNPDLLIKLLELGADLKQKDKDGFAPLHYAKKNNHLDAVEILLAFEGLSAPLQSAIDRKSEQALTRLLTIKNIDVNKTDSEGFTPLHKACLARNTKMVEALLKAGADVTLATAKGYSSLHIAAQNFNIPLLKILLKAEGANINITTAKGLTLLMCATENYDCAEFLIKNGANPNAQTELGTTALHFAAKERGLSVVRLLLRSGADKRIKDKDGKLPLDLAGNHPNLRDLLK